MARRNGPACIRALLSPVRPGLSSGAQAIVNGIASRPDKSIDRIALLAEHTKSPLFRFVPARSGINRDRCISKGTSRQIREKHGAVVGFYVKLLFSLCELFAMELSSLLNEI